MQDNIFKDIITNKNNDKILEILGKIEGSGIDGIYRCLSQLKFIEVAILDSAKEVLSMDDDQIQKIKDYSEAGILSTMLELGTLQKSSVEKLYPHQKSILNVTGSNPLPTEEADDLPSNVQKIIADVNKSGVKL